jgi:hypothetical protein
LALGLSVASASFDTESEDEYFHNVLSDEAAFGEVSPRYRSLIEQ